MSETKKWEPGRVDEATLKSWGPLHIEMSDRDFAVFVADMETDTHPTEKAMERAREFNAGTLIGDDYHWETSDNG